jgi:hypothetical protein
LSSARYAENSLLSRYQVMSSRRQPIFQGPACNMTALRITLLRLLMYALVKERLRVIPQSGPTTLGDVP